MSVLVTGPPSSPAACMLIQCSNPSVSCDNEGRKKRAKCQTLRTSVLAGLSLHVANSIAIEWQPRKDALTRILRRHGRDHSFGVQWDWSQQGEIFSVVVVTDGSNVLTQDEVSSFPVLHPRTFLVQVRLANNICCGVDFLGICLYLVTANKSTNDLTWILFSVNVVNEFSVVGYLWK